jgi:hypothetical protein
MSTGKCNLKLLEHFMTLHPLKKQFIELYQESGWSQAEVARQLELTRGGVNGIITGPTVPSLATVKLFQLILGSRAGDGKSKQLAKAVENWAEPLLAELRGLDDSKRAKLVVALADVVRAAKNAGSATRTGKS